MKNAVFVGDIIDDNGKTIRENNLSIKHDIPIGSLVEVTGETWYGEGACEIFKARLWVVSHDRDCDGTPLYTLSPHHPDHLMKGTVLMDFDDLGNRLLNRASSLSVINSFRTGYNQESLKVIEVTGDIRSGKGALKWGALT